MQTLIDSPPMIPITRRPAWRDIEAHYQEARNLHLGDLFQDDPKRAERFAAEALGLYPAYSEDRITAQTMALLLQLARREA